MSSRSLVCVALHLELSGSDPPECLLRAVFPSLEDAVAAYEERVLSNARAQDIAFKNFARTLSWLRRVLLQDAAVLYAKYPSWYIWTLRPFCTFEFQSFSATLVRVSVEAQEAYELELKNLPEVMKEGVNSTLQRSALEQKLHFDRSSAELKPEQHFVSVPTI